MKQRVHAWIYGIVKGVFFRQHIKEKADSLGIKGFVRNTDSNVEVVFEGEREKIDEMLKFCKTGPSYAKVKEVKTKEETYSGEFKEFKVLHI